MDVEGEPLCPLGALALAAGLAIVAVEVIVLQFKRSLAVGDEVSLGKQGHETGAHDTGTGEDCVEADIHV
ncbi:hypothetical protein D3C81_2024500 [compost metagenome]